jgi:hypothetical protein
MTTPTQGPWKVVLLLAAKQQMRESAARAATSEQRKEFRTAVADILSQLAVDPIAKGDPLRHYRAAGLLQLEWLRDQILTVYGVDEANKIVYVKECRPVLGHPLARP